MARRRSPVGWLRGTAALLTWVLCYSPAQGTLGFQSTQTESPRQERPASTETPPRQQALETIQYLLSLLGNLPHPGQRIIGYAAIGQALSLEDQDASRQYFRQSYDLLEKLSKEETKPSENQLAEARNSQLQDLRQELMSRIQQVDPAFVRELTKTDREEQEASGPEITSTKQRRRNQRARASQLLTQAYQRLGTDPAAAVALAQQSLALGVSPGISQFLLRLRQKDAALADHLFEPAFATATRALPPAMEEIMELAPYMFPSLVHVRLARPTDPARARLFLQAVTTSLLQAPWLDNPSGNERQYYQASRHFMAFHQLLPMYQLYAPNLLDDLNQIMDQVMTSVPGRFQNKLSTVSNPDDPIEAITRQAETETDSRLREEIYAHAALVAASRGETNRAEQFVQRITNPVLRRETKNQVALTGAQVAMERQNWLQFDTLTQLIKDPLVRADLLIEAAGSLSEHDQTDKAREYLTQAYPLLTPLDASAHKAKVYLNLATAFLKVEPMQTYEMAQAGVLVLNQLEMAKKKAEKAPADADTLSKERPLRQHVETTFRLLGQVDFERAIQISGQLQNPEQRIIAQAASCREVLFSQPKSAEPTDAVKR